MKNLGKILVAIAVLSPLMLVAENMAVMNRSAVRSANTVSAANLQRAVTVNITCPAGWTKTFDISGNKSKWGDNRPVVICKPNRGQVMNCPQGTFFYVKGNENLEGSRGGEIGCHTPVQ